MSAKGPTIPLSNRHLHRPCDSMGFRDFLCLPQKRRRARSQVNAGTDGEQVDLATLPRSEPDLRIGSSIRPTAVPSTPQNLESNGT